MDACSIAGASECRKVAGAPLRHPRPGSELPLIMDMPSAPVRVIARLVAQPDKIDELRALLAGAGARSRAYSECRAWNLLRNRANPREFVSVSEWVDAAAYETRMRDPEWAEMTSRLPDLIDGEIGFELYHVIL